MQQTIVIYFEDHFIQNRHQPQTQEQLEFEDHFNKRHQPLTIFTIVQNLKLQKITLIHNTVNQELKLRDKYIQKIIPQKILVNITKYLFN